MNFFIVKFLIICCLVKLIQTISNETLFKINKDLMYYIAGGERDSRSLNLIKYVVSIRTRNPQKYFGDNHYCAGTIISDNVVLTSAHCVMDKRRVLTRARRLLLVAGTPNRLEPTNKTVQFPVDRIVANSNFVRKNRNDIAIIHLKRKVPADNENIKIIKMPTRPPVYNTNCTVIGWGRMLMKGPLAVLPLHLEVRLLHPTECKSFLREHYYDGVLCAGDSKLNDEDPCRGDTGGPLICNEELTGIISWTLGCGSTRFPSLYTDVWHHRNWINDHLNAALRPDICFSMSITLTLFVAFFW